MLRQYIAVDHNHQTATYEEHLLHPNWIVILFSYTFEQNWDFSIMQISIFRLNIHIHAQIHAYKFLLN